MFPWPKPPNLPPTLTPPPSSRSSSSIPGEPNPFFLTIQSHLNSLFSDSSPLRIRLHSAVQTLADRARQSLLHGLASPSPSSPGPWASISLPEDAPARDKTLSMDAIQERLAGVPVYALSNAEEDFVLVSGVRSGKNLGLFCFKEEDAEALLEQMRSMNVDMRQGAKVVPVALNKVFQLKVDGVALRFLPDSSQIANAIKVKEYEGHPVYDFPGVPIFQSRSLVLKSQDKKYRPAFFRKEDLDDSLRRASRQQRRLNPALRKGDIEVSVLEDIIAAMKENSSKWDDIVFIPPGFNVAVDPNEENK
ncbi:protein TIC 22-like, chloroplastic [Zingiber officinale]|uniref:protein TIC 22-like, chloroplastic n=1 Tax=Zingiber officinale TaxID=94328 RepID=UPI001C4D7E02|nr:protein TIC 22-like, chloroplastic [Zingiber officinale]